MSTTHRKSRVLRSSSGAPQLAEYSVSGANEWNAAPEVADGIANQLLTQALTVALIRSVYIYSNTTVTLNQNGPHANEVQSLDWIGTVTAGTFTMTYSGQTTAGIAFNCTASAFQAALEALSNIAVGDVSCTGGPLPETIYTEFTGALANTNVAAMTFNATGLTGGTGAKLLVTTIIDGIAATVSKTIRAGVPYEWDIYHAEDLIWTTDITAFYISNDSGTDAELVFRILYNNP